MRIVRLLNSGLSIAEIATRERVTDRGMRNTSAAFSPAARLSRPPSSWRCR